MHTSESLVSRISEALRLSKKTPSKKTSLIVSWSKPVRAKTVQVPGLGRWGSSTPSHWGRSEHTRVTLKCRKSLVKILENFTEESLQNCWKSSFTHKKFIRAGRGLIAVHWNTLKYIEVQHWNLFGNLQFVRHHKTSVVIRSVCQRKRRAKATEEASPRTLF